MNRPLHEIFNDFRRAFNFHDRNGMERCIVEFSAHRDELAPGWTLMAEAWVAEFDGDPARGRKIMASAISFFDTHADVLGATYAKREYARWGDLLGLEPDVIRVYSEVIEAFDHFGETEGSLITRRLLSYAYSYRGNMELARSIAEEVVAESRAIENEYLLCEGLISLCESMAYSGQDDEAISISTEAIAIAQRLGNDVLYYRAKSSLGSIYFRTADYPELVAISRELQALAAAMGDRKRLSETNTMLAICYGLTGDHARSLELFLQSLEIEEELNQDVRLVTILGNISMLYYIQGQFDTALEYTERAFSIAERLGTISSIQHNLVNIGGCLLHLGRIEEAEDALNRVADGPQLQPIDRASLPRIMAILRHKQGRFDEAKQLAEESLRISEELGDRTMRADTYKALRDIALDMNDLKSYVKYNELFIRESEEKSGKETARRIAVQEREQELARIEQERQQERAVLYSTLPKHVADRVIKGEQVTDHFEMASVLFLDIVGFTSISDRIPAGHVVHLLDAIFAVCDDVCQQHGLTKVKTIGDSYLAVCGVPEPLADHAQRTAQAALDMMQGLQQLEITMPPELGDTSWVTDIGEVTVRIGLHCGPVVAGVVGRERLQYDVWGDTVNTASRMESTGKPGKIQVSSAFHEQLSGRAPANCRTVERGTIDIKGKGSMTTYWLERTESA